MKENIMFAFIGALIMISIAISIVGINWIKALSRNPEAHDKILIGAIATLGVLEINSIVTIMFMFMSI